MPVTVDLCPRCGAVPVTLPQADPWCADCEWNLDSFPVPERAGWVWRRITAWDRAAGFRADRLLAGMSAEPDGRRPKGAYRFLVGVSAALMVLLGAAVVTGARLIAAGDGLPLFLLGLILLLLAWAIRPRFGRVGRLLRESHRLPPDQAPALRAVIGRVARELGEPVPDVLALDYSWNAGAAVVGFRRTRVLLLGVPMLLAIEPAHLVALIGHELGHFRNDDGRRSLLTRPARTTFGAMSETLRPRRGSATDLGLRGAQGLIFLAWQVVAGLTSLLLYAVHLGLHVVAARDDRRRELRADAMAVRVAGSAAALETVDLLAVMPQFGRHLQRWVPQDRTAAAHWRSVLTRVRGRELESMALSRQLSIRSSASLFASHPAPGRRHQYLSGLPVTAPAVVVDPAEAASIERELAPYAEAMHRVMVDASPWEG